MTFDDYSREKQTSACTAQLPPYVTTFDDSRAVPHLVAIGSAWSERCFGGPLYRSARPRRDGLPIVNLVFVQSHDGNTGAADPSTLGGGATDKHVIYEGLTRVDADAVLAGGATAREPELVFSVWHPELVALRRRLHHPRHPAQVIVTSSGALPWDHSLMLQTPELSVFVIAASPAVERVVARVTDRPWITVIDAGNPLSMTRALCALHARGIRTISAVGGRRTAASLLRERLISDLYLTTSPIDGGEPHTPFYDGAPLPLTRVLEKAGTGPEAGVRFEYFVVSG
jgi:riboflavin biosynthesis pyrimidine reductase